MAQVKKQEIRGMLTDVDKEGAASVSFNDFVEMVTPKVLARDPKVSHAASSFPTKSTPVSVLEKIPYSYVPGVYLVSPQPRL